MTAGYGRARRLVDARQQHDRDHRECRGKAEGGCSPDPSDQHAAQRGATGKRHGAREFDSRVRRRQLLRSHQRRHQRRRCDAVGNGAAHGDKAEQREQWQRHPAQPDREQDRRQRRGAQRLGARHQPAPRDPVGKQAGRNREQDEGQGQRGLQQAGLAFADAQQQHRDDRRGRKRNLLGRLGGEVGPGETVERWGQLRCIGGGHDVIPWRDSRTVRLAGIV